MVVPASRNSTVNERTGLLAIGSPVEVCEKELAPRGLGTPARRFDRHKHRVDFSQNLRVFESQHPAVLFLIVYLEEPETVGRSEERRVGKECRSGGCAE